MSERASEGVIQFRVEHTHGALDTRIDVGALESYRRVLARLGLVGLDRERYGGAAFGNVSQRVGSNGDRRFVVSGTETGAFPVLSRDHYVLVVEASLPDNLVRSEGPILPSSESLTHAALYAASPAIGCVLHVHSPEIFAARARLDLPRTSEAASYGTPAMAEEVARLVARGELERRPVLAMDGHEDGVVAFGADPASAAHALLDVFAAALGGGAPVTGPRARSRP